MAEIKRENNLTMAASTMLEVIVAMVMILIIAGIALTIFSNVISQAPSYKKIKAAGIIEETFVKAPLNPTDESFQAEDWRVEKKVAYYGTEERLRLVQITVFDSDNKIISQMSRIIRR
jgi:cytochrome c-type biogenesis protein CcmE